jgi:hypothetical protein
VYRLFADRLIKLFSRYVVVDEEQVLDGKFYHGPYPNADMLQLAAKGDFPVACVTLVDSPVRFARYIQSTEEIEGSPVKLDVTEVAAEVSAYYQVDVLHHEMKYLWREDLEFDSGVMNQIVLLTCENPWLADDAGDQCLRCRPIGPAMNMDGLEESQRYHRGTFQLMLDGRIITSREVVRVEGVIWEIDGAET